MKRIGPVVPEEPGPPSVRHVEPCRCSPRTTSRGRSNRHRRAQRLRLLDQHCCGRFSDLRILIRREAIGIKQRAFRPRLAAVASAALARWRQRTLLRDTEPALRQRPRPEHPFAERTRPRRKRRRAGGSSRSLAAMASRRRLRTRSRPPDLRAGDVDTRRAFRLARLAPDARVHDFARLVSRRDRPARAHPRRRRAAGSREHASSAPRGRSLRPADTSHRPSCGRTPTP